MAMTVLVVDDSVTMLMSLKTTLSMNGFAVETACHGQAALDKLSSGLKPNLILTDINMPVMEKCGRCRVFGSSPSLPLPPKVKPPSAMKASAWVQQDGSSSR